MAIDRDKFEKHIQDMHFNVNDNKLDEALANAKEALRMVRGLGLVEGKNLLEDDNETFWNFLAAETVERLLERSREAGE